jgi:hypothetical protein
VIPDVDPLTLAPNRDRLRARLRERPGLVGLLVCPGAERPARVTLTTGTRKARVGLVSVRRAQEIAPDLAAHFASPGAIVFVKNRAPAWLPLAVEKAA